MFSWRNTCQLSRQCQSGGIKISQRILLRSFTSTRHRMLKSEDISASAGEEANDVLQQASELVDSGKWQLCHNGRGLERPFKFKTFKATWDFMSAVAAECKKTKHHPEWSNVYNQTHIRWTTHNPEGLSSKDTHMAKFCDAAALEFKELEIESCDVKIGADGKVEAGDCCVGNKT